jgi:hypothetical protein
MQRLEPAAYSFTLIQHEGDDPLIEQVPSIGHKDTTGKAWKTRVEQVGRTNRGGRAHGRSGESDWPG